MSKRVVDVGNCVPDHAAIRSLIEASFGAQVIQTHGWEDTLTALRAGGVDLVLVNRALDQNNSDGLEIIRQIKADSRLANTPCMLVTNYPEHQAMAVQAGAERGFGKAELNRPETLEKLENVLGGSRR